MGDWRDTEQLEVFSTVLKAIAEACDQTFSGADSDCPPDAEYVERFLGNPAFHELLDLRDAPGPVEISDAMRTLLEELHGHILCEATEARERRMVRAALCEKVGEENLRHTLLYSLLLDGIDKTHLVWDRGLDGLEPGPAELAAIAIFRKKPSSLSDYRSQRTAVGQTMGWLKPDGTRAPTVPLMKIAIQYAQVTTGSGPTTVHSTVRPESQEVEAPLDGHAALALIARLHDMSEDTCLRRLRAVRARCNKLLEELGSQLDGSPFDIRLDNLAPDLSCLPTDRRG